MTQSAPNSYKDPYWTDLATGVEAKLGLPDGLLAAVVTKGERSNADQVSEAGAKTPFQIIPATREAALKKYGIDAYLNPQNAAEVAGMLLKDSLDRNKGNVAMAVGEYHGGTDRANWGPRTKSYIARVVNDANATRQGVPASGGSMFQRAQAAQQSVNPASIASIFDAYQSGRMTPEESADFEADVKAGLVMLPRGAALNGQQPTTGTGPTKPEAVLLPKEVTDAYVAGKLSDQERAELEADIQAGVVKLPPSAVSQIPTGSPNWQQATEQGVIERPKEPTLGERLIGTGEAALTTVTGGVGGAMGLIGGTVEGITRSIMDGTYGTQEGVRQVEQIAAQRAGQLTYQPRTEQGVEQAQAVGQAMGQFLPIAPLAGETAALSAATRAAAPAVQVTGAAAADLAKQGATRAVEAVKPPVMATVEAVKNAPQRVKEMVGLVEPAPAGTTGRASVGAAALPQDVVRAQKAGNLPQPIDLTLGAETRDALQLAFEKEQMKGPLGQPLRARAEENNLQALQNFDALIDMTDAQTPDLAAAGNKVTRALSQGYKAAKAKTRVAYEKASKSDEALIQMDPANTVTIGEGANALTTSLIDYLNQQPTGLKTTALTDHAKQYMLRLGMATKGEDGMLIPLKTDVKTMEMLRREINAATGFEPVEVRDATILKKLIDANTEPVAGPLYKEARLLREAQARKYENRAVIARLVSKKKGMDDPQVYADQVFQRSVVNGAPEEITFLKRVLNTSGKEGQQAWKELQGSMVRYIRDEATKGMGMDSADNPIISPAKLNQTITALDKNGRLDLVVGKKNAEIVRDLNDVVKYVNTVPPGTLINNSGTVGTLLAAIGEAGATGALTGLPVPALSIMRALGKQVENNKLRLKIDRALNAKPKANNKF